METKNWYALDLNTIAERFGSNLDSGLSEDSVLGLRKEYGRNVFDGKKDIGVWGRILRQIKSPLILILLIAGLFTFFLGEYTDTIVIFLALFINALIGTLQENKASKAFEQLSKSQEKFATVIRGGKKSIIQARDLVRGDVIVIESGIYIPADIRIITEKNLLVNESVLTGEWVDVSKGEQFVFDRDLDLPIIKQSNMLWMGTLVSGGYGTGIVVEIGNKTQIGEIATSLAEVEEEKTPIKKNIERIARLLSVLVVFVIVVIFVLGISRGESAVEMILVAIAVAVAVMPEGLPAAVTAVLAVGMSEILKRGGLVRNLHSAETLGSTTVVLTDKTGTITEAKMTLTEVFSASSFENGLLKMNEGDNKELLKMAVLSSNSFVEEDVNNPDKLVVRGGPIEKAVAMAGLEHGISQDDLLAEDKRIDLLGFDSKNGFSASLHQNIKTKKGFVFVSGKPELILKNSAFFFKDGEKQKMVKKMKDDFSAIQEERSNSGMRVIAVAHKPAKWNEIQSRDVLKGLVFVGLLVFDDPIRSTAKNSISKVQGANVRVIMVTGDNPVTAGKIAKEVGIMQEGDTVLIGDDVDKMSDEELNKALKTTNVFARMIPSQKLRLSRILQDNDEIVAMTGDGVNDAPALQGANIGIAMGTGTEVAKEASDLVLLDCNFSVITFAIEEGRRIIDNLKKIIGYLLSTSFSEIFLIGGSLALGYPLPLLPGQILWSNIVEEGLMNFAFVFEPGEDDLMKRNPRDSRTTNILTKNIRIMIAITSLVTGIFLTALYFVLLKFDLRIEEIRTIMFGALSIDSIFFALSLKTLHKPIWKENLFSNKYLVSSWLVSILFLLSALFVPPIQKILSLTTLTFVEVIVLLCIGIFNLALIETVKYFVFERR